MLTPGTPTDRWDVLALLGQGGMARVDHVRDRHRGTDHVLEVLHDPSASGRLRILREGQVQGRMLHPNVVEVTEVVEIEGAPALVMERVDGPSLDRLLPSSGLPLDGVQEARATYANAEAVLRRSDEVHDFGLLLARRALLELPTDPAAARAYFDEAASVARRIDAPSDSPLGESLDDRAAFSAAP